MTESNATAPMPLLPETWTVKEVVADLKADLVSHLNKQDEVQEEVLRRIDSKADKADLVALGVKIDGHGERINSLEEFRTTEITSQRFRNRVWAVTGSVAAIVAILVGSLIGAHVF